MRRIIFFIVMPIYALFSLPVLLVISIIGRWDRPARRRLAYRFNQLTSRLIFTIAGARLHISGLQHIPADTNYVLIGNHRSMLDIPLIVQIIDQPLLFIAKDGVLKIPFVSWWLWAMDGLFLDRTSPKQGLRTILSAIDRIKAGESAIIFPEGTRNTEPDLLPFKQGSMKLASKTNVPVIPFCLSGTADVFENNGINLKPGDIYLRFAKPIYLNTLPQEIQAQSGKYIRDIIQAMYTAVRKHNH